jgi:predicted aspartyl protease
MALPRPRQLLPVGMVPTVAVLLACLAMPAQTDPVAAAAPSAPPSATLPAAPPVEEVLVSSPEPRYVAPTTRDRIGRIWAPVLINGRGPYRLVLDTGATRSAITQRVVDDLGTSVLPQPVRLRGVTGTATVQAVKIDRLEFGELLVEDVKLPIMADAFGGADGVLGGEGLKGKRVEIRFLEDRISIMRSHRKAAATGYAVVPFRYAVNRGLRVQVQVGSVKATGLIDTGAEVTVGNTALREALAERRGTREESESSVMGVTLDVQQATRARIPSIVAGQLIVRNANIAFSDLHIFEHWHLTAEPALLIGMDVLGMLDTLVIDYGLGELQIRSRRGRP